MNYPFNYIFDFISQLKKHINKLKDICLNIHKITKSIFKGNYFDFLKKFIEMVELSKYHDYFYSLFTKINNCIQDKQFDKAYDEIPIAQYICELIGFYNANMFQNNKDTIYFDNKELLKQFNRSSARADACRHPRRQDGSARSKRRRRVHGSRCRECPARVAPCQPPGAPRERPPSVRGVSRDSDGWESRRWARRSRSTART